MSAIPSPLLPSGRRMCVFFTAALFAAAGLGCGCGGGSDDAGTDTYVPMCGNAKLDDGEECDDGLLCGVMGPASDGCSDDCVREALDDFPVNDPVDGSQIFPVVAALPAGYVMVYQDTRDTIDQNTARIRFRLVGVDGGPWTGGGPWGPKLDFPVSATPLGPQSGAAVSVCEDGAFAIVWSDYRSSASGELRGRFFMPSSEPAPTDVILSGTVAPGRTISGGLAGGCLNGNHLFVWAEIDPAGAVLRGRVTDTSGVPVVTDAAGDDSAFDVEPNLPAGPSQPAVGVEASTGSVWIAYRSQNPTMIVGGDVLLRRMSATFGLIGNAEFVSSGNEVETEGPMIAILPGGAGAMIVWAQRDPVRATVRARLYDALANPRPPAGSADDTDFAVDIGLTAEEPLPSPHVTALADGTFLVAWVTQESGVVSAHLDADASPVGAEPLAVLSATHPACVSVKGPVVAGGPGGGFVASWESTNRTIDDDSCGQVGCGVRGRVFPAP